MSSFARPTLDRSRAGPRRSGRHLRLGIRAQRGRTGLPAEHRPAARREVRRAVDCRHRRTLEREELGTVDAAAALDGARAVSAGDRTAADRVRSTSRPLGARRRSTVSVWTRALRTLRPANAPAATRRQQRLRLLGDRL